MATITFKNDPVNTAGNLPSVGTKAPAFTLTGHDFSDVTLDQFSGKKKVLSIVPSLDTPVCQASARRFNEAVAELTDTVILNISADLPFAQGRFCESEGLKNIVNLSTLRSPSFGEDYGALIVESPLAGLLSRAVLVLDEENTVIYAQHVPEITTEPDYEPALQALAGSYA